MAKCKINNGCVDVVCGANEQINIDHLNLLAMGNNPYFLTASYRNEAGKHIFTYNTQSNYGSVNSVNITYLAELIAGMIEFSFQNGLNLLNIVSDKKFISMTPNGVRFVYIPTSSQKTVSPQKFALNMLSIFKAGDKELVKALKKCQPHEVSGILRAKAQPVSQYPDMPQSIPQNYGETTVLSTDNPSPAFYGNLEQNVPSAPSYGETTVLSTDNPSPTFYGNLDQNVPPAPSYGETTVLSTDNPSSTFYGNIEQNVPSAPSYGETTVLSTDNPSPVFYGNVDQNVPPAPSYGETTVLSTDNPNGFYGQGYHPIEMPQQDVVYSQYTLEHPVDSFSNAETTLFSQAPQANYSQPYMEPDVSYKLYLIRNSNSQVINVTGNYFTLGKDSGNVHAYIDNNSVSRHHATITFENGCYYIMDNKSTNGTTVEGIRLQPYEKAQLFDNSIVSLGTETITIKMERG